ncbi:asparaginase domain-containing protein [Chelatococcus asaccharovorans]|uniref:asparaginase domain-containing protein n=1 Tax=Chelatococcus asaccharovorans TaxID=28210 RepID=UPI00224C698F|nr:asparaginase domain-containing protein [Chelatococcus asaccharovorans]CAH1653656.1 putative Asparaginase [Chelatococcus asaccharovorans]CAH1685979.1 putative Asparaginase [Chelatococcus asaccharovorans]
MQEAIQIRRERLDHRRVQAETLAHHRAPPARKEGTQGSNYVEENAYFLSLTLKTASPVVLTAAMRPASGIGSDGAMNLVDAVRMVLDPASHAHGATVVMNGRFHARNVTKGP